MTEIQENQDKQEKQPATTMQQPIIEPQEKHPQEKNLQEELPKEEQPKEEQPKEEQPKEELPKIDEFQRAYATGKRKNSVARVWIKPGKGEIKINKKQEDRYFARHVLKILMRQPFVVSEREQQYDVFCTVKGGGLSGQAGAIRHGISKALLLYEPQLRKVLRSNGLLTRDARVVERKKYGRRKARRSFQFSKR